MSVCSTLNAKLPEPKDVGLNVVLSDTASVCTSDKGAVDDAGYEASAVVDWDISSGKIVMLISDRIAWMHNHHPSHKHTIS